MISGLGILVFFAGALILFHLQKIASYTYRMTEKMFDGPKYVPFIGNTLLFAGLNSEGIYNKVQKICSDFSRFTRFWLGPWVYIVIYEPKDVEVLLSSTVHIKKSNVYRFMHDWVGLGLLTSYGQKWKSRRKIITPSFHFKILEDFLYVFNKNGNILTEKLSEKAGKGTFDVYPFVNLYALDNICETALGVEVNAQMNSESKYVRAVKDLSRIVNLRAAKIWLASDFILNLTSYGSIYRKSLDIVHGTTENIIIKRRKEIENSKDDDTSTKNNENENIGQKRRLAFMDMLLLSENLSNADIREEVDTFMFEGHDTVSSGIGSLLYSMGKNQEIQEKAYQEQVKIFGDSKRDPTAEDLSNMKYLEMVVKECQRLYPSVPLIGRTIEEDLPLSEGYFFPKGVYVMINIAKLHRNPKIWQNPDQFNPDNFLPDVSATRNPYSFVPFSAGPRNCIGQRFAMMEMKSFASKILRNFKINMSREENSEPKFFGQLVLSSSNGINIEVEKRN